MDVNTLRIVVMVIGLVAFVALVLFTWSRRRARDHAEAAQLPFTGDSVRGSPQQPTRGERS